MKIEYEKLVNATVPTTARKCVEGLHVIEVSESDATMHVDLYVASKTNAGTLYLFKIYPDAANGSVMDLLTDTIVAIRQNQIDNIAEADISDVTHSVNIVSGMLASQEVTTKSFIQKLENGTDGTPVDLTNKIVYDMLNGERWFTNISDINWDEQIKNVDTFFQLRNNTLRLIHLMLTQKTFKPDNSEEEIDVETLVENEVKHFAEFNKLGVDYSVYDNDIATKREKNIARLIDVLTFYNELLIVTGIMKTQIEVMHQMSPDITSTDTAVETVKAEELPQKE